ncbi:MAG TPA: chloride channel protein [Anaerolineales bacterium]|nr:chloride channel protein [Anaerolineales bacterium]
MSLHREPFRLSAVLDRWSPPEEIVLILSALLIGAGTGLGAVIFIWLLRQINLLAREVQLIFGSVLGLLLFMAVAGLIVGYMVDRWAKEAKGHGVPEVMEAIALRGGRIRPIVAAIKILASSLTIGAGGSAGREGPIVQVGSALGSTLGQVLHFSNERVRTLVACGAAAGIAATFNAPIAGSIFALEVILGRFTVRYFGTVVISSVVASVIGRIFLGDKPAFTVPAYQLNHLGELLLYTLLGILAAIVAVAFIRLLYRMEGFFDDWKISASLKAALGLLLTGLFALILPGREVLGPGLDFIGEAIADDFTRPLGFLAVLLVLKLIVTCFTLGSGNSGGVFAPTLFMGAVLGGIVGTIAHNLWPTLVVHPGAYAIVGMAAVFAGAARGPITAVLIVFEMSNDYRLILPLMLATVISTFLAENVFKESIYTLKLKLKGISIQGGRDVDVLQTVRVIEAMTTNPVSVPVDMTLEELSDKFARTGRHGLVVLDKEKKFWGLVTLNDLRQALMNGDEALNRLVSDIGVPRAKLAVAFPDETLGEALARMGIRGVGRMPVLDRADPNRLAGLLRRDDVIRGYRLAVARRAEIQHRTKQFQLRNLDEADFVEMQIEDGFASIGQPLSVLASVLPHECVLVSVRRDDHIIIPHGDTVLQYGDRITAFIKTGEIEKLRNCLGELADQESN